MRIFTISFLLLVAGNVAQAQLQEKDTLTRRHLGEVQIVGSRSVTRTRLNAAVPVDVINLRSLQENAPQFFAQ